MKTLILAAAVFTAFSTPVWADSAERLGIVAGLSQAEMEQLLHRVHPGHTPALPDVFKDCHPEIDALYIRKPPVEKAIEIASACMENIYGFGKAPFGWTVEAATWDAGTESAPRKVAGIQIEILHSGNDAPAAAILLRDLRLSLQKRRFTIAFWPVQVKVRTITPGH